MSDIIVYYCWYWIFLHREFKNHECTWISNISQRTWNETHISTEKLRLSKLYLSVTDLDVSTSAELCPSKRAAILFDFFGVLGPRRFAGWLPRLGPSGKYMITISLLLKKQQKDNHKLFIKCKNAFLFHLVYSPYYPLFSWTLTKSLQLVSFTLKSISWDQPVLGNLDKDSCSRKQGGPSGVWTHAWSVTNNKQEALTTTLLCFTSLSTVPFLQT